jgi:hypothetical protein
MGFCPCANGVGPGLVGQPRGGRRANWCMGSWLHGCRASSRQGTSRGEASKVLRRCRQMHAKHADGTGAAASALLLEFGRAVSAVKRHAGPRPIRVFCVHLSCICVEFTCLAASRTVAPRQERHGLASVHRDAPHPRDKRPGQGSARAVSAAAAIGVRWEITASISRAAMRCVMAGLGPATHGFPCRQQPNRG